jgi:hypothetical protein
VRLTLARSGYQGLNLTLRQVRCWAQPPGHGGADWGELVAYLDQARSAR